MTQAAINTTTSSGKSIVSGAARSAKSSESGSMKVSFATVRSSTASRPPRKPTITPSITNGQRMNQLVAPTSFITRRVTAHALSGRMREMPATETRRRGSLAVSLLAAAVVVVAVLVGIWVAGGLITNDFGVAMVLTVVWMAIAGV